LGLWGLIPGLAQAQYAAPNYSYPGDRTVYPASFSRYYYYSPYDSGYYTLWSPGYRSYYNVPGASYYYRPDLPRDYYSAERVTPPNPPTWVPSSPGSTYSPNHTAPTLSGQSPSRTEQSPSPGSSAPSFTTPRSTSGSPGSTPAISPEARTPSPLPGYPPNNGQGNYPSSGDYFIPDVRRDGDPGPYWAYKSTLNNFYFDPRGYEVTKLDIDRQYFNRSSPHFFSPAYRSYYRFPGTSTFYTSSSNTMRR
jgi:hypothetical protein